MKANVFFTVLLFSLVFGTFNVFAQKLNIPIDEDTKLITYQEVVPQEGDADKLYLTAIAWINSFFQNPNEATTIRDRENGKIVIDHRFKIYNVDKKGLKTDAGIIKYNLKLEFKPNKYRYTFTNFNLQAVSKYPIEKWLDKTDPQYNPAWENYLFQVDTTVNGYIKSLKKGMTPKIAKPDEW